MATKTAKKPAAKKKAAKKAQPKKAQPKKDLTKTYNKFKTFEGRQYTGMTVGRSHKWHYDKGEAVPVNQTCHDGVCDELDITLNDQNLGIIKYTKSGWKMDTQTDQDFVDAIGEEIFYWYE